MSEFLNTKFDGMTVLGSIRPNGSKKLWFKEPVVFGYYEDSPVYFAETKTGFCSGPDLVDCIQLVLEEDDGRYSEYWKK